MADMNIPSMFDTQYAMDRQRQDDAMKAGQLPLGGGMMYASSLSGDIYNQGLMGLAGLMGGTPDPMIAKQQALEEVFQQFGNPQTPEDAVAIADALQAKGLYNEAMKFMNFANEMRKSMPKTTYKTIKIGKTNDKGQRVTETWQQDNSGNLVKLLGTQLTNAPSGSNVSNDVTDFEYWKNKNKEWTDEEVYEHMRFLSAGDPIAEAKQIKNFEIQQKSINNDLVNLEEEKKIAGQQIQNLTLMQQLFEAGATTNYGEEYILSAKRAANRLFGANFETASTEALSVAFKNEALNQVQKLSGAASDKDIEFVEASRARLGLSPQANKLLIEYNLFLADKQSDMDDYMTDWVADNPEVSYAQYKQEKNKWRNNPENFFNLENKMSLLGETSQDNITLEEQTKQNDIAFDALKAELEAAQNN